MPTEVSPRELGRFAPASRKIITFARLLDWDVRWTNNKRQSIALRSEDGKSLIIPSTNVNANRTRSWLSAVIRHSDMSKLRNVYEGKNNLVDDPDAAEVVGTFGVNLKQALDDYEAEKAEAQDRASTEQGESDNLSQQEEEVPRVADMVDGPVDVKYKGAGEHGDWYVRVHPDGRQEYVCKAHDPEYVAPKGTASIPGHNRHHLPDSQDHLANMRERSHAARAKDQLEVVARRPWLARQTQDKQGGGYLYESPYVDVVTLEDGTETYECRQCQNWRSVNPRSVAGHSSRRHGQIETEKTIISTDTYEVSGITRSQSAEKRLANEIVTALDAVDGWREMDSLELATSVASVMVEARPDRAPTEPLTDAQVLSRIASLIDRGQMAALNKEMEALAERLRESESVAEEASRKAARAESNLNALRDLLNETKEE